jgi:hypothetical protein
MPNVFEPTPDETNEDDRLPAGTIRVTILDGDNKPIPNAPVSLGILHNSVAKGESRQHVARDTNALGDAVFDQLETGAGVAYRVTSPRDGATFAALPFQLPQKKGMRVGLHVYPVARSLEDALIVMQGGIFLEMKDDRVQIEEAITVFNFGRTAWVPNDVVMELPETFTALSAGQQMSDTGVDAIDKKGARLRGTFGPGRQDVEFRWQLPYGGDKDVELDLGLPPHTAIVQVVAAASDKMKLEVPGFDAANTRTTQQGIRVLETQRSVRPSDTPLRKVHIALRDLPVAGPARIIATCLAGFGVVAGLGVAASMQRRPRSKRASKAERALLLEELEELERARQAGDVGPKTYERARKELIDALARTLGSASS